jgi:hypothetical protein
MSLFFYLFLGCYFLYELMQSNGWQACSVPALMMSLRALR